MVVLQIIKKIPSIHNTSNHTEYQPWVFNHDTIIFDNNWWHSELTPECQNNILKLCNNKVVNIVYEQVHKQL